MMRKGKAEHTANPGIDVDITNAKSLTKKEKSVQKHA